MESDAIFICVTKRNDLHSHNFAIIEDLCESTKKRSSSIEHVRFIGPDEFGGKILKQRENFEHVYELILNFSLR